MPASANVPLAALRVAAMLLAALAARGFAAGPFAVVPAVEEPRSFGHFVGDVLSQRIPLDARNNGLRLSSLPPADRAGLWFQRRQPRFEIDDRGRHWLVIDYQIINSPRVATRTELPTLSLTTDSGAPVTIAGWPVAISPLTSQPAYANGAIEPLRPDRTQYPLASADARRPLVVWSIALLVVLAAWRGAIAWSDRRDALHRPFARALRQLDALDAPDAEGAWICMHRALNTAAGRVVGASTLDRLLTSAPHLTPLRADLEEFYRRSNARFFAGATAGGPYPLRALCRKLRQIEKRNVSDALGP